MTECEKEYEEMRKRPECENCANLSPLSKEVCLIFYDPMSVKRLKDGKCYMWKEAEKEKR